LRNAYATHTCSDAARP